MTDQQERRKELEAQAKQMGIEWVLKEHSTFRAQMDLIAEETLEAMTELGDVMFVSQSRSAMPTLPLFLVTARSKHETGLTPSAIDAETALLYSNLACAT